MLLVRFEHPETGLASQGELTGSTIASGGESYPVAGVRLLAPCVPSKIVCVGRNYADHAKELGNTVPDRPLLFLKPRSAVIGPGDAIVLPDSDEVHFEAELAVVIGQRCRNVRASEAADVILGYTCMNDISDRVAQRWETNWVRAKAFDTSAPIGPAILTADAAPDTFRITLKLNGQTQQEGTTANLFFSVPALIEAITAFMTLEPGDVIATGTPAGVGALSAGDIVEVDIDAIGVLRNPVS